MTDPRLEDHAFGVELQLTELVEKRERARVQGRHERVEELTAEIEALQADLAATAERIVSEQFPAPEIAGDDEPLLPPGPA
ncbi:MAG: hypothetical protein M3P97_08230 [Actinomycetota bacterium]|jgi:hypothetical protein|nr:hypothetical protein [Actinomycetota bacterium]